MTQAVRLQFLVCPQRDFIGTRAELEPSLIKELAQSPQPVAAGGANGHAGAGLDRVELENFWDVVADKRKLHVGREAVHKLRGKDPAKHDPFVSCVKRLYAGEIPGLGENLRVVLDEDWHPRACSEFPIFGVHCVKGSEGAMLVGELQQYRWHDKTHQLRANSINPAANPVEYHKLLEEALDGEKPEHVKAGIMGVWTHIKVEYLAVALNTMWPFLKTSQIGICAPLCASPYSADHEYALEKFKKLKFEVFDNLDAYLEWFADDVREETIAP